MKGLPQYPKWKTPYFLGVNVGIANVYRGIRVGFMFGLEKEKAPLRFRIRRLLLAIY